VCMVAPALEPGCKKAFFVSGGRLCAVRRLAPGVGAGREIETALASCRVSRDAGDVITASQAEDLLLIGGFVRRPPPELKVLPLDAERIAAQVGGPALPRAA
jgi:hypothetical protein